MFAKSLYVPRANKWTEEVAYVALPAGKEKVFSFNERGAVFRQNDKPAAKYK